MKTEIAFIRWHDASYQESECTSEELNPGIVMESAGIVSREDDKTISLSLDSCPEQGLWRRTLHVPKAYILNIKRFRA